MKYCIIIGAQKAGTTTLYDALRLHPKISTAREKEINFFSFNYENGIDWYKNQFPQNAQVALDASPQYLHEELSGIRLERDLPESHLICILRDPIDRALSNYRFNVSRGQQNPGRTFLDEIRSERGRRIYMDKGLYHKQLLRFDRFFRSGRILILDFDALKRDQLYAANNVFGMLKLDTGPDEPYRIELKSNETRQVSTVSARMMYIAENFRGKYPAAFESVPSPVKSILRASKKLFGYMPGPPAVKAVEDQDLTHLIEFYREDIRCLAEKYSLNFG